MRSRIVLAAAGGAANYEIAEQYGISRPTVTKWRNRFAQRRLEGLLDEPRPGRPRTVTDEQVERIVTTTLESTPKDATHWSTRSLAAHLGVSQDAVWRTCQVELWTRFGAAMANTSEAGRAEALIAGSGSSPPLPGRPGASPGRSRT